MERQRARDGAARAPGGACGFARLAAARTTVFFFTLSYTATTPCRTDVSDPSQRSAVSHTVPRTVALLNRADVRLPFDCPQRRATTFFSVGFLLAESERRAVARHAAATFATRVSSVAAPRGRLPQPELARREDAPSVGRRQLDLALAHVDPRADRDPQEVGERPAVHQHDAADRTRDGIDALHRGRRRLGRRRRSGCDRPRPRSRCCCPGSDPPRSPRRRPSRWRRRSCARARPA